MINNNNNNFVALMIENKWICDVVNVNSGTITVLWLTRIMREANKLLKVRIAIIINITIIIIIIVVVVVIELLKLFLNFFHLFLVYCLLK